MNVKQERHDDAEIQAMADKIREAAAKTKNQQKPILQSLKILF